MSSELQQQQQQIFESVGVSFETPVIDGTTFGLIKLNARETNDASLSRGLLLDIGISADNSGSMADVCSDSRTKMQHVAFAVSQIVRKVAEREIQANVDIKSFDEKIVQVISGKLDTSSVEEMVSKVVKIFPNGGTDILSVLKLEASHKKDETIKSNRIFVVLSDGQDSTGCGRDQLIQAAGEIDANTNVIMIGVGNDHDSILFRGIVNKRASGHYTPVSNVEDISVAISELLYGVINNVLKQPTITVSGGEIYSWSSNTWVSCIKLADIVIGRKKTYLVRSLTPQLFKAVVEGVLVDSDEKVAFEITDIQYGEDLTYDKYRLRTMEFLGESTQVGRNREHVKELKGRLKNMMIELKAYMDANKLRGDKKYQLLCDDIFMCHQTMGSEHGTMYAAARQTSQGTQGIYNNVMTPPPQQRDLTTRLSQMNSNSSMVRGITACLSHMQDADADDLPPPPLMSRGVSHCIYQMEQDEDENLFGALDNSSLDLFVSRSKTFSRNPAAVRNTSMAYQTIPEVDEEEEDAMNSHQMLASDDSPYANIKELTFIREISTSSGSNI